MKALYKKSDGTFYSRLEDSIDISIYEINPDYWLFEVVSAPEKNK